MKPAPMSLLRCGLVKLLLHVVGACTHQQRHCQGGIQPLPQRPGCARDCAHAPPRRYRRRHRCATTRSGAHSIDVVCTTYGSS